MNEKEIQLLKTLTVELLHDTHYASEHFHSITAVEKRSEDFQKVVKPFADRMLSNVKEWESLVMKWINEKSPKYVYPVQIHDTCENLTIISVTAFQKDTRRRRFINTISAIEHVLDNVLKQI